MKHSCYPKYQKKGVCLWLREEDFGQICIKSLSTSALLGSLFCCHEKKYTSVIRNMNKVQILLLSTEQGQRSYREKMGAGGGAVRCWGYISNRVN